MKKDQDFILVMGATGNQGHAVANVLLGRGYRVRAVTRRPDSEPAKALAARGAQIVQADFNDPVSLERAMAGAWGAFAVQNTWEAGAQGEEEQGKRVAEIARKQGVTHFVYTSVGSAHRATGIPHFDNKWRVEQRVRELGFPSFTILRPVFFMENLVSPWFKPATPVDVLGEQRLVGDRLDRVVERRVGLRWEMFSMEPVERSSMTKTSWPSAIRASLRWEPSEARSARDQCAHASNSLAGPVSRGPASEARRSAPRAARRGTPRQRR